MEGKSTTPKNISSSNRKALGRALNDAFNEIGKAQAAEAGVDYVDKSWESYSDAERDRISRIATLFAGYVLDARIRESSKPPPSMPNPP